MSVCVWLCVLCECVCVCVCTCVRVCVFVCVSAFLDFGPSKVHDMHLYKISAHIVSSVHRHTKRGHNARTPIAVYKNWLFIDGVSSKIYTYIRTSPWEQLSFQGHYTNFLLSPPVNIYKLQKIINRWLLFFKGKITG